MIWKKLLMLTALLLSICAVAQEIKPFTINACSSTQNQVGISLTYTLGELAVTRLTDGSYSLGQGFINSQPSFGISSIDQVSDDLLSIKLYPNPSSELVHVDIITSKYQLIKLIITDLKGSQVQNDTYNVTGTGFNISIGNWESGNYLFSILDQNGLLIRTYKFIKQ